MTEDGTPLFVVGDSISIDYGSALHKHLLDSGFKYSRKNEGADPSDTGLTGQNGGDSRHVLAYLQQLIATKASSPVRQGWLIVNCGLHDIKRHRLTSTFVEDVARSALAFVSCATVRSKGVEKHLVVCAQGRRVSRGVGFLGERPRQPSGVCALGFDPLRTRLPAGRRRPWAVPRPSPVGPGAIARAKTWGSPPAG